MIRSRQDSVVRKADPKVTEMKVQEVESDVELELDDGEDAKGDDKEGR
jgi:hypothetical protein